MLSTLTSPTHGLIELLSVWLRPWQRAVPAQRQTPSAPLASTHELAQGATVALARPLGRRLECLSGCIWITLDYDERDHIVQAGESFVAASDQRALIHALEASRIRVAPAVA